ncbi:uncharacterized protein LOC117648489 [Thrips palmi]|uniref:Uncharacterized protein LOC117648489 n=1 Tax=Thrips palmi TaxID=161013 RepID=A0A6P8Z921_THRPL|nr:uncharacterized protein LOC117648489 [Thrips palmi]
MLRRDSGRTAARPALLLQPCSRPGRPWLSTCQVPLGQRCGFSTHLRRQVLSACSAGVHHAVTTRGPSSPCCHHSRTVRRLRCDGDVHQGSSFCLRCKSRVSSIVVQEACESAGMHSGLTCITHQLKAFVGAARTEMYVCRDCSWLSWKYVG